MRFNRFAVIVALAATLLVGNLFAQTAPPPPEFQSGTLKFRVLSDAQADVDTWRVRFEGGTANLYPVGTELDVFIPSDAVISSNAGPIGDRASLKPGREFTVTFFVVLANGLMATELRVYTGLTISAAAPGRAEGRRGYWGNLPAAKVAAGLANESWGAIKNLQE